MNLIPSDADCRKFARHRAFWAEMTPCEHTVQIYADEAVFLDVLEGFVAGGLESGEAVIVLATEPHREALRDRLVQRGINLRRACTRDCHISLDAEEMMSTFMVNEWPDEDLFHGAMMELLVRARGPGRGRRVRAFGEMVAMTWARGLNGATVRLEHLWQQLCEGEKFAMFCAYPQTGFTQDAGVSIRAICDAHSRVLA